MRHEKAGNVIAKNYERRDDIQTSKKGINDYVTSVDKAAEAEIIEIIQNLILIIQLSVKNAVH